MLDLFYAKGVMQPALSVPSNLLCCPAQHQSLFLNTSADPTAGLLAPHVRENAVATFLLFIFILCLIPYFHF